MGCLDTGKAQQDLFDWLDSVGSGDSNVVSPKKRIDKKNNDGNIQVSGQTLKHRTFSNASSTASTVSANSSTPNSSVFSLGNSSSAPPAGGSMQPTRQHYPKAQSVFGGNTANYPKAMPVSIVPNWVFRPKQQAPTQAPQRRKSQRQIGMSNRGFGQGLSWQTDGGR